MSFSTIASSVISVGSAIKAELWNKVKNNFDDHEQRLNQVETSTSKIYVFEHLFLNASSFSSATGVNYFEAKVNFTITAATIRIFEKGTLTGFFEIDVKKSVTNLDGTSFTSVFTTKPKIDFSTASDYDISNNQVFDVSQISVSAGDFLRFDITQMPTSGVMSKFLLSVYGE